MRAHKATKKLAPMMRMICAGESMILVRAPTTRVAEIDILIVLPCAYSVLMTCFRLMSLRVLVLRAAHTVAHLDVRRQHGPNHSPGGDCHDQKPPDHPHDDLGYQKATVENCTSLGFLDLLRDFCG